MFLTLAVRLNLSFTPAANSETRMNALLYYNQDSDLLLVNTGTHIIAWRPEEDSIYDVSG